MCGIVGYVGTEDCVPILMEGLNALSYRGYDSAGVAVWDGKELLLKKEKGKLDKLTALLEREPVAGRVGIGHTRWATHGEPSFINSHPHTDGKKKLALVHNGIIENYRVLKEMLESNGCKFVSDTDTEVAAQLMGYLYTGDPLEAVQKAIQMLEGSFALAILFSDTPDRIYCACKDSPMVVGLGKDGSHVASDIPALLKYTRDVYFMDDRETAVLTRDAIKFYNSFGQPIEKAVTRVDWDVEAAKKGNYPHYMIKEICEQPIAFKKTLEQYANLRSHTLKDVFPWTTGEAKSLAKLTIVSCGTAYHAGLMAKKFIERMAGLAVHVEVASEFRYGEQLQSAGESLMVISQSGETADTIAALRQAKKKGLRTIAVCNVIGSTIAREADTALFTYAGPEIAVAATKSYVTQLAVLYLLALDLAVKRGKMDFEALATRLGEMERIPEKMQHILDSREKIQYFASRAFSSKHVFFIGRGFDCALSMEAALKLKEISYIHSEAYAAGELKHGTIALIEEGVLVVAIATQPELAAKMASSMEEVRVRGAQVLALCNGENEQIKQHSHEQWTIEPTEETLAPFLAIVPMQLLAYYMAVQKGCSVDQPRNLAKSVTVE